VYYLGSVLPNFAHQAKNHIVHRVWLKISRLISPTTLSQIYDQKFPNLFPICQICALFGKRHLPKKLLILLEQNGRAQMLKKSTPKVKFHRAFPGFWQVRF